MTVPSHALDVVESETETETKTKSKIKIKIKKEKDKKGFQGKKDKVTEGKAKVRVKDKGSTMEKVPPSPRHQDPILNRS